MTEEETESRLCHTRDKNYVQNIDSKNINLEYFTSRKLILLVYHLEQVQLKII